MLKRLALLLLFLAEGLIISAQIPGREVFLSAEDVKIVPGETQEIEISLTNEDGITAIQCDIYLPEGLSWVQEFDENTHSCFTLSERKDATHFIASAIQKDGGNRFCVYSLVNKNFSGDKGELVYFKVKANENMAEGTYQLKLAGAELSSAELYAYYPEDKIFAIKVVKRNEIKVSASVGGKVTGGGFYLSDETVTLQAIPDEGYHFVKWSNGKTDNPLTFVAETSQELTAVFEPNIYKVDYVIDGETVHTESVTYGINIPLWEAPEKEGYTFSGWSEIPTTMPAHDLEITGSYTVNNYVLTYLIDDVEYKKETLAYGTPIMPLEAPAKEGYTFSGWSEIPATMPANDVTVTGTFMVNTYNVTFILDGEIWEQKEVKYAEIIETPDAPDKEGYTFAGWKNVPATMPAHDIEIIGEYTINYYQIIYKVDGEIYQRVSLAYGETIVLIDEPQKEGYLFSGWSEAPLTMPAHDIEIYGEFIVNGIQVIKLPELVDVYSLEGIKIKTQIPSENLKQELVKGIYIINGKKIIIGY